MDYSTDTQLEWRSVPVTKSVGMHVHEKLVKPTTLQGTSKQDYISTYSVCDTWPHTKFKCTSVLHTASVCIYKSFAHIDCMSVKCCHSSPNAWWLQWWELRSQSHSSWQSTEKWDSRGIQCTHTHTHTHAHAHAHAHAHTHTHTPNTPNTKP